MYSCFEYYYDQNTDSINNLRGMKHIATGEHKSCIEVDVAPEDESRNTIAWKLKYGIVGSLIEEIQWPDRLQLHSVTG